MEEFKYRLVMQKDRYGYAKCGWQKCPAFMRYKLSEHGKMRLTKMNCYHRHLMKKCKSYKFRSARDYLADLPQSVSIAALKTIICPQFGLT